MYFLFITGGYVYKTNIKSPVPSDLSLKYVKSKLTEKQTLHNHGGEFLLFLTQLIGLTLEKISEKETT